MWAYKIADSELGVLDYTTVYSRDPFSFWQPIDQSFLQAMSDFANYQKFTFITPFWSHYYSAYLDYNVYGTQPATSIIRGRRTSAQAPPFRLAKYTPTGLYWEGLTSPNVDTTAPRPFLLRQW